MRRIHIGGMLTGDSLHKWTSYVEIGSVMTSSWTHWCCYFKSSIYFVPYSVSIGKLFSFWTTYIDIYRFPWWRHQMERFSAQLAICAGTSPVPGEFPTLRPVTRSFDDFFDLRLNKRLSKQSWGWWFETLSRSLWRHRNAYQNSITMGSWRGCWGTLTGCFPQGLSACRILQFFRHHTTGVYLPTVAEHGLPGHMVQYKNATGTVLKVLQTLRFLLPAHVQPGCALGHHYWCIPEIRL